MSQIDQQIEQLIYGCEDVLPPDELKAKLQKSSRSGEPLKVKLGLDPTAPDIHLGHTVVLRKLRQFQNFGHQACLIIGDFTAKIGDPSGKSETRKQLSDSEVKENSSTYVDQIFKILIPERTKVIFNSEWLSKMSMEDIIRLCASHTVARMLERDDFSKRYAGGQPISIVEFLYPLLQGYDSIAIESDVELGGTDQKFNLLVGRELQRAYGQTPQVVMTVPLLEGTDGVQKMSKSLGNYIGILEAPREIFGKIMSIPDSLILRYLTLVSSFSHGEVEGLKTSMDDGENPSLIKRRLASNIVSIYWGGEAAGDAEKHFDRVFKEKAIPDEMPEHEIPGAMGDNIWLPRLLTALKLTTSNGEAKRLISQGAVKLDGEAVADPDAEIPRGDLEGKTLQVGKRRFARILKK